jgi:uncharacterized membrane protein YqjE
MRTHPTELSLQDLGPTPPPDQSDKSVGELVSDVSERTSTLVREEIELAKTEISEKVNQLVRGSVVGAVAGVFLFFSLILIMEGVAWLLNDLVFDNFWLGFFVEAGLFILIGVIAVLIAVRAFKKGAPPTPDLAIEEAKLTRERLEKGAR